MTMAAARQPNDDKRSRGPGEEREEFNFTGFTFDQVVALEQDLFYDLVNQDVRGKLARNVAVHLRHPELAERWYRTLIQMKKSVEATLAARRVEDRAARVELIAEAELAEATARELRLPESALGRRAGKQSGVEAVRKEAEARNLRQTAEKVLASYLKWRTGSLRFRSAVEERLGEAGWRRQLAGGFIPKHLIEERERLWRQVLALTEAIEEHRDAITTGTDDPDSDAADRRLWSVIDPDVNLIRPKKRRTT